MQSVMRKYGISKSMFYDIKGTVLLFKQTQQELQYQKEKSYLCEDCRCR
jgi:ACT domain-containing protein